MIHQDHLEYVPRLVDRELDELMTQLPALALEGPRGVGKTVTAERRARTAYYLDDPGQRAVAEADPNQILTGEAPVLIDEWQRVPAVWDAVRRAVDRGAAPGSFLLTGSTGPLVPPSHPGAGRIVTLRMRPLSLAERGIDHPTVSLGSLLAGQGVIRGSTAVTMADYTEELVATGFPAIRRLSGRARGLQLDGYLQRIIDHDFRELGKTVKRPEVLKAWLSAYAASVSTVTSFEKIRDAATPGQESKPPKSVTIPYRDILESLWILDPVPAWTPSRNPLNRLGLAPRHHLVDPGLACRVLGLDDRALLAGREPALSVPRDGTLLGRLFESLVALCLKVQAQPLDARVYHLRLQGGRREVDLILERPDHRILAIEVKLGAAVKDDDVKHLLWLKEEMGPDLIDALVINTGPEAYRRPDGIAVVPAALLGP